MNVKFRKLLVNRFSFLIRLLPEEYWPAAEAFKFSLVNEKIDCEREVPKELWPTLAYATLHAITGGELPSSYEEGVSILENHNEPVLVQKWNYPEWNQVKLLDYHDTHPYYYVLGGFTTYPQGGGIWRVEDRYDWHFRDFWRVPEVAVQHIPEWILNKFCFWSYGGWYLSELDTLAEWCTPYWHRSYIKLGDYLYSTHFED